MTTSNELLIGTKEQLDLTIRLHRAGLFGVKEDPADYIPLKSERRSPHYLDIRPGLSDPGTRKKIANTMAVLVHKRAIQQGFENEFHAYDHYAGTPEAMTSYAALIADLAGMSLLQPRVDTQKASGNKTPILGWYKQGDKVAEIDDVVTDGESKITTIKSLGKAGLVVADYFVVVDRQEGGARQVFEETGVQITPALLVSNMVEMLRAEGEINQTQFDNVAEYLEQYGDQAA